ncbi:MAG: error-prone DNA polymerase [Thermoguttaceae bacterium]
MPYAELHAKSNFSFLEGASHPEELVRRAAELGYAALAVTDRNSLAGVVRAHGAAKDLGLKLVVGAEITPEDAPPVVLWATDRAAYGRLSRLLTRGRRRAAKGQCRLSFADLAEHAEGLLAGVCASRLRLRTNDPAKPQAAFQYRELFGQRGYLLAELHYGGDDQEQLGRLLDLSRQCGMPLAAAGDVHYHIPERQPLGDVLCALRLGTTVSTAGQRLFPNAQRYLRSPEEMAHLFRHAPEALEHAVEIARRTEFSLDQLRYEYPEELAPAHETPIQYLTRLAWEGARRRYPDSVPEKVWRLVEHELRLIEELRYEAYFLTVWDLVEFARRRGILCQGRGSAANSAVCYCLGITSVDPERMDVLFERFVSRERNEAPDIDVDFEHERREEVLQYLYAKYGRDRAGMTAEVITYRPRSAVRDVGRALGLPPAQIDRLAKRIDHFHGELDLRGQCPSDEAPDFPKRCREAGIDPQSTRGRQLVELVGQLVGFPRHLSQHTGGMVITRRPLCELVPIENAAMPDRTVIQWNKDDLDELGILKVDCLALGMLTAIRKCFALVQSCSRHTELTLANIPPDDPDVYAMIRRADTMGVFQIESRAQMSMLPRLRPRCFYDLVIEVAIVRPGPIQGNMVHPYLRRRNGEEPVVYPNEAVRRVLEKTLGVPLFQEQAMRLAVEAAGFTPGEADQLRRAMGAWRRPGVIDQFRRRLLDGMQKRGFTPEYAEAVFRQIRGFGEYGFPESHAASFALLVYVSAWLKYHYPAAFAAALLNSQPMGFYAPPQLVRNAREHGVEVLPVDVNRSEWDCTLEKAEGERMKGEGKEDCKLQIENCKLQIEKSNRFHSSAFILHPSSFILRLGFRLFRGMARGDARRIVEARGRGEFRSMGDFARRTGLGRPAILRLAKAGALGSLAADRRRSLWEALDQDPHELPLFDGSPATSQTTAPLPAMSPAEEVLADYRAAGLSLRGHPLEFFRGELDRLGVVPAVGLGRWGKKGTGTICAPTMCTWCPGKLYLSPFSPVQVAGLVLVRQRPSTAKGITFITLEDETGTVNLIVRLGVWRRYRAAALGAVVLLAEGRLQRRHGTIHLVVTRLEDLSTWLGGLASQSRDFC